ncbi:MAG: ArsR/SmtB family transcription factor [Chitinophagales bacterium]
MGISKTEGFTKSQNQLANLMKAIGHPARVAIIDYLLKQETCICKDIVDELPLSQPTISQHLKALKNVGLIQGNVTGNRVCYCLDKKGFQQIAAYCGEIFNQLNKSKCC